MDHHPSVVSFHPENTKKRSRQPNANMQLVDIDEQLDALDAMFDEKLRKMFASIAKENEQKKLLELRRSKIEARLLERTRAADQLQLELTKAQNQNRLLRGELTELKQAVICSICMEARCSTAFQCGHLSCRECSSRLNQCHICRRDILQRSHIFL